MISKPILPVLFALACLLLWYPHPGWAETGQLTEHEVKTAYLYNFAKYVDWPQTALARENTALTMCIAGKGPLNEVIETLAGKVVRNRRLVIRQLGKSEDLDECQILFINSVMKPSLTHLLTASGPRSILTISDSKGFAAAGGMIELVPVRDKIRFEINNRSAQNGRLRISSHLLRLATTVIE